MMIFGSALPLRASFTSAMALSAALVAPAAHARPARISVPAMPMAQAIERIGAAAGVHIAYDPDAVRGLDSLPVKNAVTAEDALRIATRGRPLTVNRDKDGSLVVTNDILVVARRDDAETSLLVRNTTTSNRMGETLRDQPRSTTVISSKLIAEQQAQTVFDALRNAGGVSVNTAAVQGGTSFTVRGFDAGGIVNGLPAASNSGTAAGVTQPIANVERIEVLKGPDALLAGANNEGGTINIVLKKPSTEERLYISAETGSFGEARLTVDANNALSDNKLFSARIIAAAASSDRNAGGYRGDEDYLFAPSIRFKNATTDIILSVTAANQIFGATPYVSVNPDTNKLFDLPRDQPIIGKDQYIQIGSTRLYGEATQTVGDWLTLVARGQHEFQRLQFHHYTPFDIDGGGNLTVSNSSSEQDGSADTVDGYARFKVATGPLKHTLTVGYTYVQNDTTSYSSSTSRFSTYNILTGKPAVKALAPIDSVDYISSNNEQGEYAQYLLQGWKLSLLAGVRHNAVKSTVIYPDGEVYTDKGDSTVPSFGAIFDIARNVSIWGNLVYGYVPTFDLDAAGKKLPDIKSRNLEGGVKIDLFGKRALFNASYFQLRESNLLYGDPQNPGYSIAAPGQQGKGIDLDISGEIRKGWTVKGSLTRTIYTYLTPSDYGDVVAGQARDQYSVYSSYHHDIARNVSGGLGAGVYGRSSAAADSYGDYYVPPSLQVDMNAFLKIGALDLNLGVDNILGRTNYSISRTDIYIPYATPRTWRLTAGYRF